MPHNTQIIINIIIIIIVLFLLIERILCPYNKMHELFDNTKSNEAVQNIASVYNTGEFSVSSLNVTGYKFNLLPRGSIIMFNGSVVPAGWLICDGSSGTPDLRGRFILGAGQGIGLTNRGLAQTGGTETHTLTIDEMPSHSHTGPKRWGIAQVNFGSGADSDGGGGSWTSSTGGSQPHNNMPPFYVLYYIMKS